MRFLDQGLVHEVLRRAVVDALGTTPAPELVLAPVAFGAHVATTGALPLGFGSTPPLGPPSSGDFSQPGFGGTSPAASNTSFGIGASNPRVGTAAGTEAVGTLIRPMTPLGQFRQTFIIAVDDEGLAIIDQHVAHERILFEQISERLTTQGLESQRLLTPVVLELSPGEHQTLSSHRAAMARFGFELADFGGASLQVIAVPALLDWTRIDEALRAVAADLDEVAAGRGIDDVLRKMAATMACHAAVKANAPLTREKMQYLLDELRRTAHSSVCPHGRPVVLRLTRREIERNFERI